jgi:hypothetical protein
MGQMSIERNNIVGEAVSEKLLKYIKTNSSKNLAWDDLRVPFTFPHCPPIAHECIEQYVIYNYYNITKHIVT